jgi:hypothetical protein
MAMKLSLHFYSLPFFCFLETKNKLIMCSAKKRSPTEMAGLERRMLYAMDLSYQVGLIIAITTTQ